MSKTKKRINSKYEYGTFAVTDKVAQPQSEKWERINILLTKFRQRSVSNFFIEESSGKVRDLFSKTSELKGILGQKTYLEIIRELIDKGILTRIDVDNPNNIEQKLYTFENFTEVPTGFKTVKHARVHTSLNVYYDKKAKQYSDVVRNAVIPHLRKLKICVTLDEFQKLAKANYPEYVHKKELKGKKPMSLTSYINAFDDVYGLIERFNRAVGKDIYDFVIEDGFSGRVHTIITMLPGWLRNSGCVKINDETVYEIDVKQIQPLILAHYLKGTDYANTFACHSDIYIYFKDHLGLSSRDEAKIAFNRMVNSRINSKYHQYFCSLFPEAGEIIADIKSKFNLKNRSSVQQGKHHTNVAFEAQSREVSLFKIIWKRLNKKRIPFATIHDAILIPESRLAEAQEVMDSVLATNYSGIGQAITRKCA